MSTDKLIFVDTWAWLALANKKDKYHEIAKRGYKEIREKGYLIVTTDYILDEVITALFRNVPFNQAVKFIESLLKAIKFKQITLERVDEDRFNFAWELRKKYQDKPDISFTDLTSFVIMQELGITKVFTGDEHFEKVNLGFEIFPKIREHS